MNIAQSATTPRPPVDPWEAAYLRFETPEQEVAKFTRRLKSINAPGWPRDSEIVEIFCGRGNGLVALAKMGFYRLEGVDLSPTLLAQYVGPAKTYIADCRTLPFLDAAKDIVIVQGGLHHLPLIPADLKRTIAETRRVLRPTGRMVIVEPWLTPFLRLAHAICQNPVARRAWGKLNAMATMVEHEGRTYEQWLNAPGPIMEVLEQYYHPEISRLAWGKLIFVGRPRPVNT